MQSGGGLGGFGSLLSGAASAYTAFCWVAREVYGEDDPRWLKVRDFMLTEAPAKLRNLYLDVGPKVAEAIRANPGRKAEYRAVMDDILEGAA